MKFKRKTRKWCSAILMTLAFAASGSVNTYGNEITESMTGESRTAVMQSETTQIETMQQEDMQPENMSSEEKQSETMQTEEWQTETEQTEVEQTEAEQSKAVQQEILQSQLNQTETGKPEEYLSFKKGSVELTVLNEDGAAFPSGTQLQFWTADETTELKHLLPEIPENLTEILKNSYCSIQHQTAPVSEEEIFQFYPIYVQIFDGNGTPYKGSSLLLDFHIIGDEFFQLVQSENMECKAVHYTEDAQFSVDKQTQYDGLSMHTDPKTVTLRVRSDSDGWFSVILQKKSEEERANPEEEEFMIEEMAEETAVLYSAAALATEGQPITNAGSGYTLVNWNDRTYSGIYNPVRYHANTELIFWNQAGNSVTEGSIEENGVRYYIPHSLDARGLFGFRFTNVAYNREAGCNIDLLITVTNFRDYGYDSDGNKVSSIYPFIGQSGNLGVYFHTALPDVELKYDFVQAGTSNPVAGNYRFNWLDIDGYQKFGFCMQNGSLDNRYALANAIIDVEEKNVFDKPYYCMYGTGTMGEDDPRQSIVFELGNTTGIYLLIRHRASGKTGSYSEKTIKSVYSDVSDGKNTSGCAVLNWSGAAYGPDTVNAPVKFVSNDLSGRGKNNTVPDPDTPFYYSILHFVPEEMNSYYYANYALTDVLPTGVDYDNWSRVIRMEDGADVTSWFHISCIEDTMTMAADPSILGIADFYGYNYQFDMRVRMDPAEIVPSYQENTAVYTVQNEAQITAQHITDSGPAVVRSDMVTTSMSTARVTPAGPFKALEAVADQTEKRYENVDDTVCFSVYQELPVQSAAWQPEEISIRDSLDPVLEYRSCSLYVKKQGNSEFQEIQNWSAEVKNQLVSGRISYDASLQGAVIRWDIYCQVRKGADMDPYYQIINQETWAVVNNTANVNIRWNQGNPLEISASTNKASAMFPVAELKITLTKTCPDTDEMVKNAEFTLYEWDGTAYSAEAGILKYDKDTETYQIANVCRKQKNEGKYKIVETGIPKGYYGQWEQEIEVPEQGRSELILSAENRMNRGTITVTKKSKKPGEPLEGGEYEICANKDIISPQGNRLIAAGTKLEKLKTDETGSITSSALFPGEYRITETKAPKGYDLDADPQIIQIPCGDSDTPITEVDTQFENDRLYAELTLTKSIFSEDITIVHGKPCFTFRIKGVDVLGVQHTYYEMVEFNGTEKEDDEGLQSERVKCRVLAGSYTVTEEKTMRYALEQIRNVYNGKQDQNQVFFDFSDGGTGAAEFVNRKENEEEESHTDLVRNTMIAEKDTLN